MTNKMPKISIIMPVYNKQNYLRRSLDSVKDQVFFDYELIAIDDGSTDDGLQILEEYRTKDSRITIIHTENQGVSHARNIGLDKANGEYIQFLDGDDLIEKDYLEKCWKTINESDPDIIFTSFYKANEEGNVLCVVEIPVTGIQNSAGFQESFLEYQKKTGYYGFISNKLIKRSLIEKNHIRFDENLKLAEDLDFFVQLYSIAETVCYLPLESFRYVQTGDNYSRNSDIDYLGQLNIQKRIRQWIIDAGTYNIYKDIVDKTVCQYAAFAVFDKALRDEDISSVCDVLLNDKTVCDCLDTDYVTNKVHKRIIDSLQSKEINKLNRYLKSREKLKKLFGRA